MSSNPSPQRHVPASWVHELFRRFTVLYGAQRCASLYDAGEFDATVAAWCAALARFDPAVVKAALEALPDQDRSWPPSLAEFVTLCRQSVPAPEHRRALPVPRRTAEEVAAGAERMVAIKAMLGRRARRSASREPGTDDELATSMAPAACTCFVGLQRSESLCPSCAAFRRGVVHREVRAEMTKTGATELPPLQGAA